MSVTREERYLGDGCIGTARALWLSLPAISVPTTLPLQRVHPDYRFALADAKFIIDLKS
jgi:hypothetical protein